MMPYRVLMCVLLCLTVSVSVTGQKTNRGSTRKGKAPSSQRKPPNPGPAEALFQEALAAYRSNQLELAVTKLKQAYRLDPANMNVRLTLGLALYETDPANLEAQQLMESVAARFRNNTEVQLKLLDSYLRHGNRAKVTSLLHDLKPVKASDLKFAFAVAYTAIRYGQLEVAQQEIDLISNRLLPMQAGITETELKTPAHQTLMHDLGEVYFIKGMIAASRDEKTEAMGLFQAADLYEFPARNSLQMQMLAEALFRMQEHSLSAQAYEEYLKYFPDDAAARMQLGVAQYTMALFTKAQDSFQRVLEQAPRTEKLHLYLGLTLLELKDNEDARQEFERELAADRQSYQAMAEMAYLAYLEGDNNRCLEWLQRAQPLNQDWVETNMVFGLVYNRLGQFDRAIQYLELAVKNSPKYSRAHYQLSVAYRRSGNDAKAKEHSEIYERLTAAEKARQLGGKLPAN
jgi:tetratricopeptide (TPR) repeat protein